MKIYATVIWQNLRQRVEYEVNRQIRRACRPNNVATVTPVKVARLLGAGTVIESGLNDGDIVVTEGHLLLGAGDGARAQSGGMT
jgi:hypothetical protein